MGVVVVVAGGRGSTTLIGCDREGKPGVRDIGPEIRETEMKT
jgi:hypothetical protein